MTARVSMLLKSRASLTCFRVYFLPGRAKDLSSVYVKCFQLLPDFICICIFSTSFNPPPGTVHNSHFKTGRVGAELFRADGLTTNSNRHNEAKQQVSATLRTCTYIPTDDHPETSEIKQAPYDKIDAARS